MIRRVTALAVLVWLGAIRRKELYVLLVLLAGLFGMTVSGDLFGLGGMATYIQDVGLLLAWLFGWILAIRTASRELPAEEMRGTLLPLLAKPVSRLAILLGKWLGAWTLAAAATALFDALVLLTALAAGSRPDGAAWLQGYLCQAACLAALAALGIAFSTRLTGDAAAALTAVLSAAAFLVVPRIPELLIAETGVRAALLEALYHALPHFEVFDMRLRIVHGFGPLPMAALLQILAYGAALTALFLAAAWLAFRRRPVDRRGHTL